MHLNDSRAFIEYSYDMDDTYRNIEEYNLDEKRKMQVVLDDMIIDMLSNKKSLIQQYLNFLLQVEN